jgi:hypothetical protein
MFNVILRSMAVAPHMRHSLMMSNQNSIWMTYFTVQATWLYPTCILFTPILLPRVSVTKTWVWIGESVYWSSLVVTTSSSYTLEITVTISRITSHTKSSNSSSGHTAVPLELRNSREVNSHSRILSHPLGTDHSQKTQFYCYLAQTTQKTSHGITDSLVHWRADCCLATGYKHSFCCCVRVTRGVYWVVAWQCVNMSQYFVVSRSITFYILPLIRLIFVKCSQ